MDIRNPPPRDALAKRKLLTGLALASVALALFLGFILRGWVMGR
jgi:hypothetical protein